MAINQSLTYLEQCVVALSRRGQSHIPYRQSKLTNILKDCLGANCNTIMLACMWGEASHLEETISTLRLASRMMRVQNETSSVQTIDPSALIKKQEKIIRALKQELLMHDALVERTGVAYDPYTPEQQDAVGQMLEQYIDASELEEEGVLNISNYRQMIEICKQFKKKVLSARSEAKVAREQAYLGSTGPLGASGRMTGGGMGGMLSMTGSASGDGDEFDPRVPAVGEPLMNGRGGGFSLGISSSESRPPGGIEGLSRFESQSSKAVNFAGSPEVSPTVGGGGGGGKGGEFSPSKSQEVVDAELGGGDLVLFEAYSKTDDTGKRLYKEFVETRAQLKESRTRGKELAIMINEAKSAIDRLGQEIDARKASRVEMSRKALSGQKGAADVVDEEEFKLTNELKEAKRAYKSCFEQMQQAKSAVTEAQAKANSLKGALSSGFAKWSSAGGQGRSLNGRVGNTGYGSVAFSPPKPKPASNDTEFGGAGGGFGDQLDDQEAFDKLEIERVLANDPESLAFFHAQKTRRAHITQNGGNLRQVQKNKRFT